jgi:TRAP-type mannitol/chloroaromatic compound transport system permease large subunit
MVLWILIGASGFNTIYNYMGAAQIVQEVANNLPGGAWTVVVLMLVLNFFLGMLMDDYAIIMLTAPLYMPIIAGLGFDPIWFTLIFLLNIQMAYLTPPFGFNLFYLKSIVPKDVKLTEIYRAVVPFIALQVIGLIVCMIFPQIVTFLPGRM